MIDFLEGNLARVGGDTAVVEVQGVGFAVSVPASTRQNLPPAGSRVRLYTHLHVREDALQLYGFKTLEERDAFLQLLKVSGIGPKLAMAVLSALPVDVFQAAVSQGDLDTLTRISGIGKKTAQRLLLELKGRLGADTGGTGVFIPGDKTGDAVEALVSLGYTPAEAESAVQKVLQLGEAADSADLVRKALKLVG